MKAISMAFGIVCLFGLCLSTADASVSPTRKYTVIYDNGTGVVLTWNLTAPVYASRGSPQTFTWEFEMLAGTSNIATMRFEVTANLDSGGKQQIYYSILLQGTYSAGYKTTVTPIVTVPSNAMLGSVLNVSIYTSLNKWFLFPTEIRDMNYDDLQSAYNNAQSQINTLNLQVNSLNQQIGNLNQQVANLTSDKNALNQQISTLNQQVNDLNGQITTLNNEISSLKAQNTLETLTIPLATSAIAIVAVIVAIYMFYAKRKIARSAKTP